MDLHLGALFVIGLGVFGGILGAWVFQRMHIPQVVGYIAIGLLIGESGLQIIRAADVASFRLLNFFALGIIGFLVGGELKGSTFRQYGRQFAGILLGEGLSAFILVGVVTGVLVYLTVGNPVVSVAAGIVLGAIASATDPASTIDVLWEYRSYGVLTTALIATVALDDALAMSLYGIGTSIAGILVGGSGSLGTAVLGMIIDLFGSILLGGLAGFVISALLRQFQEPEKSLALALGLILMVIALAVRADMDVILATMAMGIVLVNRAPQRSRQLFKTVRGFSAPIYVIFFVLVGARLGVSAMPNWLWGIVIAYVLFRTLGKMGGARLGATLTGAAPSVRKYCGMGLFAQGGVAVGLSIMASEHLGRLSMGNGMMLGDMIIFTVTATTLVVQLLGPPFVKLAIKLGDEIGRDVKEEDVIKSLVVADVMSTGIQSVSADESVAGILDCLSTSGSSVCPVVDDGGKMLGLVSLDSMKDVLAQTDLWPWMVSVDIMQPASCVVVGPESLQSALDIMADHGIDEAPVVESRENPKPLGILDMRHLRRVVSHKVVERRQSKVTAAAAS